MNKYQISIKNIISAYIKDHDLFVIEADKDRPYFFHLYFRFPFVPELHLMQGSLKDLQKKCNSFNIKLNKIIYSLS